MSTTTEQDMKQTDIPVIDLESLFSEDRSGLQRVADEIGQAARGIGFFYVKNHGVSPLLIEKTFSAAHALFDLPLEDKLVLTKDFFKTNRGYVPVEGESLDPETRPDLKEAFKIFDKNKNGFIEIKELKTVTTTLGQKLTEEEFQEMMSVLTNQNAEQLEISGRPLEPSPPPPHRPLYANFYGYDSHSEDDLGPDFFTDPFLDDVEV